MTGNDWAAAGKVMGFAMLIVGTFSFGNVYTWYTYCAPDALQKVNLSLQHDFHSTSSFSTFANVSIRKDWSRNYVRYLLRQEVRRSSAIW